MVPQIQKLFNYMKKSNEKKNYINANRIRNYIINVNIRINPETKKGNKQSGLRLV